MKLIKDIYTRRKTSTEKHDDFLQTTIEELEKDGSLVNENVLVSLIFTLSCITQDTTSKATCMAVKFVSENPKVLAELKVCISIWIHKLVNFSSNQVIVHTSHGFFSVHSLANAM